MAVDRKKVWLLLTLAVVLLSSVRGEEGENEEEKVIADRNIMRAVVEVSEHWFLFFFAIVICHVSLKICLLIGG